MTGLVPAPPRITRTTLESVSSLTEADREAMFALFQRNYVGVDPATFARDLDGKQLLIRLFGSDGRLAGFSTIQLLESEFSGRRLLTVFSGDTVIDRPFRGQKALQGAFARFLLRLRLRHPWRPIYWFLISKGHRTYLFMRRNLVTWPNYEAPTPPEEAALLEHVARLKFPERYQPERGVVLGDGTAVRPEEAQLDPQAAADPDVRFFLERNPGWAQGDELCCLAPLDLSRLVGTVLKYGLVRPLRRLLRRTGSNAQPGEAAAP